MENKVADQQRPDQPRFCPMCGHEGLNYQIHAHIFNGMCVECGAQFIIMAQDQIILNEDMPRKLR